MGAVRWLAVLLWTLLATRQAACASANDTDDTTGTTAITCPKRDRDTIRLVQAVNVPRRFCRYWLASKAERTSSPFPGFQIATVSRACNCLLSRKQDPIVPARPTPVPANRGTCARNDRRLTLLRGNVRGPAAFCRYWRKKWDCFRVVIHGSRLMVRRSRKIKSPFADMNPVAITGVCNCLIGPLVPSRSTTTRSTIRGTSTTTRRRTTSSSRLVHHILIRRKFNCH